MPIHLLQLNNLQKTAALYLQKIQQLITYFILHKIVMKLQNIISAHRILCSINNIIVKKNISAQAHIE